MVYIGELGIALLISAPILILYGALAGMSLGYYIKAVILWLFLPAIPLLVSALLAALFMSTVARMRHKNLLTVLGSFVLVILLLGIQISVNSALSSDPQVMLDMVSRPNGIIDFVARSLPPVAWAVKALVLDGMEGI